MPEIRKHRNEIHGLVDLLSRLKRDNQPNNIYWYRGHAKSTWKLMAKLGRRAANLNREEDLISKFKQNAAMLLSSPLPASWDLLAIMQHHGVPTRLLDWSESPLIALFFAVTEEKYKREDAALWVLDPIELNKASNIKPDYELKIPSFGEEVVEGYTTRSLVSETSTRLEPIAVIGARNTSRMQAQLGSFTVIHRDAKAIEEIGNGSHVRKYTIPSKYKRTIQSELETFGIGKFQLFPELESLGQIIQAGL